MEIPSISTIRPISVRSRKRVSTIMPKAVAVARTIAIVIAAAITTSATLCNCASFGGTFLAFLVSRATSLAIGTVTHRFGLERCEFKLRRIAFAAAGPHARPLTFACWRFFLTTFAARIVHACSKGDWKVQLRAATTSATSTNLGALEAAAAIAATAALTSFPPATTTTTFLLDLCSL